MREDHLEEVGAEKIMKVSVIMAVQEGLVVPTDSELI